MCPVYAIVVAPIVRPARVPLVMWWSHWKMDAVVRTAERVCTRVVTVAPGTFPHPSAKLVTVGQAIDVDSFPERSGERGEGPLRALVIGRYSAAKGVGTILRALKLATDRGADLQLDVYGPASNVEARTERDALQSLVVELGLSERARLHGAVSRGEVVRLLGAADLLVNNAPGGADRVVYEAGASGIPVLASNRAHTDFLAPDAFFDRDDSEELARRLEALAALPAAARDQIGRRLRERVAQENSVDSWATGLLEAAGITPQG
jgi:glycosyltransferase involved in cell wall biosynthesis